MERYGHLVFVGVATLVMCSLTAGYFLMVRRKGAASGGGLAEGFATMQRERWAAHLAAGESIVTTGLGVLWRPGWQLVVARFVPAARLAWMPRLMEIALTDRGRLLVGKWGLLGVVSGLSEQASYDRRLARVEPGARTGLAHGLLSPSCGIHDAVGATLRLPDRTLVLSSVSASLLSAIAAAT